MARPHVMTPARKAALRRAQLASAAKRRGRGQKVIKYTAVGLGAAAAIGTYAHATRYDRMYAHQQKANMARQMSRKLPSHHPVSRRLARSAMSHQRSATRLQKRLK